jgi:hypothetical protein
MALREAANFFAREASRYNSVEGAVERFSSAAALETRVDALKAEFDIQVLEKRAAGLTKQPIVRPLATCLRARAEWWIIAIIAHARRVRYRTFR